jgi:methyl-accepting chemotaxis protein
MAQSVESTVNIKATADTSDVNKKLDQLMQTARQMAEEFRKANIASADFSGSIDRLSNGYSALEDSTKDVSKNIDSIGEESQESTVDINELSKALGSLANGGKVNADTFTKLAEALGMSG